MPLEITRSKHDSINLLKSTRIGCHVLREIYQKFGRVFFVKRTSLYLKSRARPVENTLQNFTAKTTQVGLQTTEFARPRSIPRHKFNKENS